MRPAAPPAHEWPDGCSGWAGVGARIGAQVASGLPTAARALQHGTRRRANGGEGGGHGMHSAITCTQQRCRRFHHLFPAQPAPLGPPCSAVPASVHRSARACLPSPRTPHGPPAPAAALPDGGDGAPEVEAVLGAPAHHRGIKHGGVQTVQQVGGGVGRGVQRQQAGRHIRPLARGRGRACGGVGGYGWVKCDRRGRQVGSNASRPAGQQRQLGRRACLRR